MSSGIMNRKIQQPIFKIQKKIYKHEKKPKPKRVCSLTQLWICQIHTILATYRI